MEDNKLTLRVTTKLTEDDTAFNLTERMEEYVKQQDEYIINTITPYCEQFIGKIEKDRLVKCLQYYGKDVVEVVRCKDCKHRDMTSKFECDFSAVFVFDDHFCSYGERREENE